MYATLGIEQDDDGDEDFIYDVDFARREEREEEEAEKLPSDFVKSPKAARIAGSQRKQKGASAKRRKNSQSIDAKVAFQVMVAGVDEEVATTLATSEYRPRKITSKHLEELESMGNQYDEVVNIVPAFGESREFESWDDFDKAFREYKRKNNLKFRIRSSETTERFNSTNPP
ncbi:hypothetical protein PC110_g6165 [Phytophthora cactorum]|uniref:Uncharacterized protein n=1 Tax=Phytophthora cactorum TaxID=29920 RepID=A0A329SLF7_9STRA|nr:hypothetical protein PC110_g6165 [Phytophthora cactorum]